jgi:hypothetical protein
MMTKASEGFFATCPRGLEAPLAEEIGAAGGYDIGIVAGGVRFSGDWQACYAANLESRLATRVLWRVGEGRYRSEDDVYRLARRLDWPAWFDVARTLRVYVAAIKSPLKSLEFITLRIKDAVCDVMRDMAGARPSVDTRFPDLAISLILNSSVQVAIALTPALVLISVVMGGSALTLVLSPLLLAAVALAALLTAFIVFDGETTWLEGLALLGFYLVIAASVWYGQPIHV